MAEKMYCVVYFDSIDNVLVYGKSHPLKDAQHTAEVMNLMIPMRKFWVEEVMTDEDKEKIFQLEKCFQLN